MEAELWPQGLPRPRQTGADEGVGVGVGVGDVEEAGEERVEEINVVEGMTTLENDATFVEEATTELEAKDEEPLPPQPW